MRFVRRAARGKSLTYHFICCHAGPLLDTLDKSYDAPAEGTGLFALQACANHSCSPNAYSCKPPGARDGAVELSAGEDICAGEEITLCYVDVAAPLAERRAALREYGFTCECKRCREEAAAGSNSKRPRESG